VRNAIQLSKDDTWYWKCGFNYPESINGRRVLLVDDVFTTGATVSACATVLQDAGAEKGFVLTIART
jgi:predicted amidophosphoribosyltransferase